ncbi:hypothetical protein AM587_10010106 [Phytophthora nicotianae]|uniref:FHA domain-containing protein n=1 Tax=Phytophthora nicotianae TaxID=4792 RepID=A0A0W8BVR0_PHYNI|nr:hypothetical protein AM587_10010106 [Phytophthora nicotianae]
MEPQPPGRRKRALEDDDRRSPRGLSESENISPRLLDVQAPSSKQVTKRQPFPLSQRRNLEPVKGVRTPLLDSGIRSSGNAPVLSFDADDVSSDEELIGIPGPDIPDPDISFSQDKLGDLSVTENNLEESVVLTLCDGLANSLTKVERDRMELLNLYTIALAQQPSPIVLGRDQFQDVFGDNIRGGMLSHLSRRHCLIHVENLSSQDDNDKMGVKARVEDTSTNGIRINGVQLKNGQSHELELEDIVTLLRIRRGERLLTYRRRGKRRTKRNQFSKFRSWRGELNAGIHFGMCHQEANFDYREELSEILSAFGSIRSFDASSYHCATVQSMEDALNDDSDVVFYTGGGDEDHLVVEAPNGLSARLEKDDIRQLFSDASHNMPKLIVVIAPSLEPGFSIEKSYTLAEFVALNDLLPIVRPADQICKMLPSSKVHNIQVGAPITEAVAPDRNVIALLNALFIPVLATHFLGRDTQVRKVKAVLAQKVRVCNVYGPRGVGKSSIAIHVAKMSYRTRGYRNGVHYFAVDKLVEHIQNRINPVLKDTQGDGCSQSSNQREDPLAKFIEGVETLLRSLPEYVLPQQNESTEVANDGVCRTDPANYPTTLLVLDGCDVVLPALEVFVLNIIRSFTSVQILLTSTEKLRLDSDEDEAIPEEAIHVEELGKSDSAKLFFKLARGHLTSRQFRQLFPDSSIEAISNDERLLGTKGNPFRISRLVYELESQMAISN